MVERNDGRLVCQSIAVGRLGSGRTVRWVWLLDGKAGRVAVEEGRRVQSERNRERGAAAAAGSEPREWDPKAKSTNAQTVAFCRREW